MECVRPSGVKSEGIRGLARRASGIKLVCRCVHGEKIGAAGGDLAESAKAFLGEYERIVPPSALATLERAEERKRQRGKVNPAIDRSEAIANVASELVVSSEADVRKRFDWAGTHGSFRRDDEDKLRSD